jgi:hypothetical protein
MSTMSITVLVYHQNWVLDLISVTTGTCNFQTLTPLDTVGAVCMDAYGNLAAACSSGGVALKHPGRVGQVSLFQLCDHLCTLTAKQISLVQYLTCFSTECPRCQEAHIIFHCFTCICTYLFVYLTALPVTHTIW